MKLLILTQYFPPEVGAPQNRLYELAVRLQKRGVDVSVLTAMPNYPQMEIYEGYRGKDYVYEEMDGLKVHRSSIYVTKERAVRARLKNYFSFAWSAYKVGKKKITDVDYILCESPPLFLGITAWLLKRNKNAKLIFNVSDLWPESAEKLGIVTNRVLLWAAYKLEAFLYKRSDLITGQTQGIVKSIVSRFPDKKVFWLPNGVDPGYYSGSSVSSDWRARNGFAPDDFILLYAGIIGHAQGLEVILKAAEKLKHEPKIKFVLLGEGPEKEKLLKMKSELRTDNVVFLEAVGKKEMPSVINAIDAAVVPLKRLDIFKGAIPSKVFENMAMKKPLLLGVEGEAKELFIDDAKAGLAFIPEDVNDLAAKAVQMKNDPVALIQMGTNGFHYVNQKFNRDKIAEDLWKFITSSQS